MQVMANGRREQRERHVQMVAGSFRRPNTGLCVARMVCARIVALEPLRAGYARACGYTEQSPRVCGDRTHAVVDGGTRACGYIGFGLRAEQEQSSPRVSVAGRTHSRAIGGALGTTNPSP